MTRPTGSALRICPLREILGLSTTALVVKNKFPRKGAETQRLVMSLPETLLSHTNFLVQGIVVPWRHIIVIGSISMLMDRMLWPRPARADTAISITLRRRRRLRDLTNN